MEARQIILNAEQIDRKIQRIGTQIVEQNFEEKELLLVGIKEEGLLLAERLQKEIKAIGRQKCELISLALDKTAKIQPEVTLHPPATDLDNKVIILVDDVLNTGKTLMYALQPFVQYPIKSLQVAVLVHRTHKLFPVSADYVGISLATTLENSIRVTLADPANQMAYLI
jgi:pyrimidine operon attenuation protein/uracil phosphoribosyltransferase